MLRRSSAVMVFIAVAMALSTAGGLAAPATPPSAERLPVTYDFLAGLDTEARTPGGSLPGTNDFGCRPSADHPRPVVLLHGGGLGRQTNWATLAPVLANEGYCVFAPTYCPLSTAWPVSAAGGLGYKQDCAWEVKLFMDRVLDATGAPQVDIVGHSLGTEIPTYWMKYLGGRGLVAHYVSLAPYWQTEPDYDDARSELVALAQRRLGIPPLTPQSCDGCDFPTPDIVFNRAVREPTPYLPGVEYTNITTRYDEFIIPYSNGLLDGPPGTSVANIVVQDSCSLDNSDHASIVANRRSAAMVLNALDPANARPVPCLYIPPITGA
ncbi:alpha/beta fold hydrolase [Aldersonia kunmingensis]|uniref:esterase/lipase family protein n=1 Tax=Aldersonia kunmingensis TaxID=408066 RepID=UPI00082C23BF